MSANLKLADESAAVDAWLIAASDDGLLGLDAVPEPVAERARSLADRRGGLDRLGATAIDDAASPTIVIVGLGKPVGLTVRNVHRAAGHAATALSECGAERVGLAFGNSGVGPVDAEPLAAALAEGLELAAYRYHAFKTPDDGTTMTELTAAPADRRAAVNAGIALAASANFARQLAAAPPNHATPLYLAEKADALAEGTHLRCRIYQGDDLADREMVGLINVGKGSEHPPCLIELIHEPEGADEATPTIALVGKSITFDSGGLSVKTNDTMRFMKYDMAGGAAVMGAMHAVAREKLPLRVVGLLPAAENAIGWRAYRVDDILEYPNGLSVEITNTDFEGRLVLADALIHAATEHRARTVVDLGTLTGEIITALGHDTAGLWSNDDALRRELEAAALASGEPVWPMPLNDEHRRLIRASFHADLLNRNLAGPGKSCQCAAFLEPFAVGEHRPRWAHLDIAGPVHVTEPDPPYAPGPTGYGARLLVQWLRALG